jgi:hypothetical protein
MAKDRPEYIQLDTSDDVTSVRDRLSFHRGNRVLLIWPEDGTVLTRKLDLVLTQREAMRRSIRLALVTHDPQVIQHAQELNISTFETIGSSERAKWRRGRSKVFTTRWQKPKDEPIPDDLKEVASRIYAEESAIAARWRIARRIGMTILLLAMVIGLTYVFLPGATVVIVPAQSRLEANANIVAEPGAGGVDLENRIIPSTRISVEVSDSGTTETTGILEQGEAPATGSVVFINLTDNPVTIPAGTIVVTSAGLPIQFQTTQAVELAGGQGLQIEVPIEALSTSSGAGGNVESGVINTVSGPLAQVVSVRNLAPTTGGTLRQQKAVTVDDQVRLLTSLRQQLQSRAYLEMQSSLNDSQCLVIQTIRIAEERSDWMTFSAEPDQVADTLSLTMRAVVDARAFEERLGQQIIYAQLSAQVQEGQFIRPETLQYATCADIAISAADPNTGRLELTMNGSGVVSSQVNLEAIRNTIAGRTVEDAIAYLVSEYQLQPGIPPQITVTPDWFGTLPLIPLRITVVAGDIPA